MRRLSNDGLVDETLRLQGHPDLHSEDVKRREPLVEALRACAREACRRLVWAAEAPPQWLTLCLLDDHEGGACRVDQLVGSLESAGSLPVVVCCGSAAGVSGDLSLNEVVDDRSLAAREAGHAGPAITRRSVVVITPAQSRELRERGEVWLGPNAVVRLFRRIT